MKWKNRQYLGCAVLTGILLLQTRLIEAAEGYWAIAQISFQYPQHPSINDSGEIVWATSAGGIVSNVRGVISASGFNPHLANSGEVVYADWLGGGPNWDLVSTTRGRLTQGGIININFSDFDVNTNGEVVYVANDTNNFSQVYSTVRGQITVDATDHYYPCINDRGEIIWNQYLDGYIWSAISSTRGNITDSCPALMEYFWKLNNSGEFCCNIQIENPIGYYSAPHVFTSAHGLVINDSAQFQWYGSINDAGTIVWLGQDGIYIGTWMAAPMISIVPDLAGFALEWSTNSAGFHVQYTTNGFFPSAWQALSGNPTTNGANFHLTMQQNPGNTVYFRLSNVSP